MDLLFYPSSTSAEQLHKQLVGTIEQVVAVAGTGRTLSRNLKRVFFVSAGAGYALGDSLTAYTDEVAQQEVQYSAYRALRFVELMEVNPAFAADETTLVVLSSKSGETPETVRAARLLYARGCATFIITKSQVASLVSLQHQAVFTGETTQVFHATYMLEVSLLAGILAMRENWNAMPALLSSLSALPTVLFYAAAKGVEAGKVFAKGFNERDPLYFVSAGVARGMVPHGHGLCVLQEKFGFDVHSVDAGDFFHSYVETVRGEEVVKPGHYLLIVPEDASRPGMLDVVTFSEKRGNVKGVTWHVVDIKDFGMPGIDPEIRKIVGPLVAEAYFKPWVPELARVTGRTMQDETLHMGKFKYYNCHKGDERPGLDWTATGPQ